MPWTRSPLTHTQAHDTCGLSLCAATPAAVVFARDTFVPGGDHDTLVCYEGILALLAAAAVVDVLAWCASQAGHRPILLWFPRASQTAFSAAIEVLARNAEEADETHTIIAQRLNGLHAEI